MLRIPKVTKLSNYTNSMKEVLSTLISYKISGTNNSENDIIESLLTLLFDCHFDSFLSFVKKEGISTFFESARMDELTAASMFNAAGLTLYGRHIVCKYLRQVFGKKCLVPESHNNNIIKDNYITLMTGDFVVPDNMNITKGGKKFKQLNIGGKILYRSFKMH